MKTLADFTRTTLIGGVLILLPIYLAVLLLAKTLSGVMAMLSPVTAQIPATTEFRQVLAILIVIAACFIAGLVVRTGTGRRGLGVLQSEVLDKIPGYSMLRSLVSRVGGRGEEDVFAPALVEIEEALVPAMIIEDLPDGRFVVLVPSVPTPVAGALYVLPAARVHRVDVPLRQLLIVYSKWGQGTGELVAAMRKGT